MKKLFKSFSMLLAAAAVMTVSSCNDDLGKESGGGNELNASKGDIFMSVNFRLPGMGQTSRSYTDDDDSSNHGVEIGSDSENAVGQVLLILARPTDYGYVASALVPKGPNITSGSTPGGNSVYRAVGAFTMTSLAQYYADATIDEKGQIAVFVVVNPNEAIMDYLDNDGDGDVDIEYGDTGWYTVQGNIESGKTVWAPDNFLMTNQLIAKRNIPSTSDGWKVYTGDNNVFHLSDYNGVPGGIDDIDNSSNNGIGGGSILVERVAARMDFRDGSPADTDPNTYHVVYEVDENGTTTDTPIIDIKLNKMCLTNMCNKYFLFGRVSNNGLNGEPGNRPAGWELCGPEKTWFSPTPDIDFSEPTGGNYVVSSYSKEKKDIILKNFSTYFRYPFYENDGNENNDKVQAGDGRWYVSNIDDVLKNGVDDKWVSDQKAGTYKVWRYLSENTLPGIESQKFGQTTVVVFKGKMHAIDSNLPNLEEIAKANETEIDPSGKNNSKYITAKARYDLMVQLNKTGQDGGSALTAPMLFVWNSYIYCGWDDIRQAALREAFKYEYTNSEKTDFTYEWDRLNSLYVAVFGPDGAGSGATMEVPVRVAGANGAYTVEMKTVVDTEPVKLNSPNELYKIWEKNGKREGEDLNNFKAAATAKPSSITIYQRSQDDKEGWGYYCYYYYKNRHNDNANDVVMGPMEFAVVRNNVYKLAVTSIKALGHPRILLNDPLSPKPGDDDESEELRISVDAEVLPWVVRVNNISF